MPATIRMHRQPKCLSRRKEKRESGYMNLLASKDFYTARSARFFGPNSHAFMLILLKTLIEVFEH